MTKPTVVAALLATLLAFSSSGFAAEASCTAKAAEKKLAGAAKSSLTTRCVKDAVGTP